MAQHSDGCPVPADSEAKKSRSEHVGSSAGAGLRRRRFFSTLAKRSAAARHEAARPREGASSNPAGALSEYRAGGRPRRVVEVR